MGRKKCIPGINPAVTQNQMDLFERVIYQRPETCLDMLQSQSSYYIRSSLPPSMGFSRQEYWSGVPSPGDLPNPGIEPGSPALQTDALTSEPPGKPYIYTHIYVCIYSFSDSFPL